MGSRFVRTDWGPNDIALLNHEMDRLSKGLDERPIIVEQVFTSAGLTPVRHSLGVKVKGILVLSGNVQEPSSGDRDTWDRDTVRLRCDGTFPQNVVLALWGTGDERFQKLVTSSSNQGTSGQVAVMDSDNTNVEFIDQSAIVGATPDLEAVLNAGATLTTTHTLNMDSSTIDTVTVSNAALVRASLENIDSTADLDYYTGRLAFDSALGGSLGQMIIGKDSQWGTILDSESGPVGTSTAYGAFKVSGDAKLGSSSTVAVSTDKRLNGPFNHPSCIAVITTNVTKTGTATPSSDGVTFATDDRILLTGQSTASQNGIWLWRSGSTAWVRPADWSTTTSAACLAGAMIYVTNGTTYGDTVWQCTTNATITVDTTSTAWRDYHSVQSSVTYSGDQTINANLILNTAGNTLKIKEGSNATMGSAVLVTGTVTVSTTKALSLANGGRYHLTCALVGGTQGILSVGTITNATSFVINSSNAADTSTVHWLILQTA